MSAPRLHDQQWWQQHRYGLFLHSRGNAHDQVMTSVMTCWMWVTSATVPAVERCIVAILVRIRVSRGLPQLQALRALMEQVYALFDRRCRTQTALDKLAKLRRRVQRFPSLADTLKKLFAPTLEKALTFLDEKLLPATSNAVERGNRRYRKRQKSVYRVRTQAQISARLALDMWREAQAEGRQHTLASLHLARAG